MFGLMRYDNPIESTNFTIARHLAKYNHVFYIDNPYTYKDCIHLRNTDGFRRRFKHFSLKANGVIDTDIPTLKVIIPPPVISINWLPECLMYRMALQLNEKMVYHRIMQVKEQFGIDEFIYINSFNFYYPNLGRMLQPKLCVYHCVDPLVHQYELKHGRKSEAQIVRESDVVICTSEQLVKEQSQSNVATYQIANAADIAHSSKALEDTLPVHPSLEGIPHPMIGYFGAIERSIDYWMLRQVAAKHRDKSFVFVGPVSPEFVPEWVFRAPNIFLMGTVPYEEMPQVLKAFDVAIIPFKKDAASSSIFPLKLFEYLGAGKPVVATDFNEDLETYTHGTVSYCNTAESFSKALEAALTNECETAKKARLAVAAENTWEHRADEFATVIRRHLEKKQVPEFA